MFVENVQDVIVGSMVQLLHCWLFHVFCRQVVPVLIVTLGQYVIVKNLDADHPGRSVMKGRRCHKFISELNTLGAVKRDRRECKSSLLRRSGRMVAPTRMRETQILTSTIAGNKLRASLCW